MSERASTDSELEEVASALIRADTQAAREDIAERLAVPLSAVNGWRARVLAGMKELIQRGAEEVQESEAPIFELHHVGIIATSSEMMERIAETLGLRETRRGYLEKYGVLNVFFRGGEGPELQFMLPDGGMLANYNRGRGGLHHVAFCTPDLDVALGWLESRGFRLIDPSPQRGIDHFRFTFIHPNLEGVNLEVIEDPSYRSRAFPEP